MHEVKVRSVGVFVGTGVCNARCPHCAGVPLRKFAPREDDVVDEVRIIAAVDYCYRRGARSLTLSSSGEPTLSPLSVTRVLELLRKWNYHFDKINLYTNGIRIGSDEEFANTYLAYWNTLGLTHLHLTVHSTDPVENARVYGVKVYPEFDVILERAHKAGLHVRANLVLSRETIGTYREFVLTVADLRWIGFDSLSAWPIRNDEDKIDPNLSPDVETLLQMQEFAENYTHRFNGDYVVRVLLDDSHAAYDSGEKLTLFPDGTLSNTWCNR